MISSMVFIEKSIDDLVKFVKKRWGVGKVSFGSAQKSVTTAGTAVALASSQTFVHGLVIKAKSANTGKIFVSPSTQAPGTTGFELEAGADYEFGKEDLVDLATLKIDATVSTEGVTMSWTYPVA